MSDSPSKWNRDRLAEVRRELTRMQNRVTYLYPQQSLEYKDAPVTVIALERYALDLESRIAFEAAQKEAA